MTRAEGWRGLAALCAAALLVGGCSGDYSAPDEPTVDPRAGPLRERPAVEGLLFGEEVAFGDFQRDPGSGGGIFDFGDDPEGDRLPVNKYLWQASLETLSFLPLDSTDPFTGVIATDWSAAPGAPDERFKVTVYLIRPELEASSLRVAVFKEQRNEQGLWVPQAVNPETVARLEDAILTRARQVRIAEIEGDSAG